MAGFAAAGRAPASPGARLRMVPHVPVPVLIHGAGPIFPTIWAPLSPIRTPFSNRLVPSHSRFSLLIWPKFAT
ncbi:hypothetical protein GCM10023320_34350 [Pseudonocardia adelaidensis]|uniref:Uncharacterized protein n=1 Tax=Pseudonocardia adelaidensis TaxID=648754 RepID=A0ABP9NQ33_9PSEU